MMFTIEMDSVAVMTVTYLGYLMSMIAEPWIMHLVGIVATRRGDVDDRRAMDNALTLEQWRLVAGNKAMHS